MTDKRNDVSPFGAALKVASIAGGLLAGLGLATGSIACVAVAAVGTVAWFLAKSKKINPTLAAHGLTPDGQAFACGVHAQDLLMQKDKFRE